MEKDFKKECSLKNMKIFILGLLLVIFFNLSWSQSSHPWNGRQCAVVLTYDDGLNVDLSNAIPQLDSLGLLGTFYISDYFNGLNSQIYQWRTAATKGHELANHTIWHPCEGGIKGREFVKPDVDLNNYTVKRMVAEIREMNNLLKAIDGKSERTFAYPCGDSKIHDTPYILPLKNEFIAARGVKAEMLTIEKIDLYNIGSYMINGESGEQLINLVKKAASENTLVVFLFHGVGGEHSLNVSIDAHRQLLIYLNKHRKDIWTAPMIDIAHFIKDYQKHSNPILDNK